MYMKGKNDFKFIKDAVSIGDDVSTIYFNDDVDCYSVDQFCYEFSYLVNAVKPNLIRIVINSCGGSVIDGMSAYNTIVGSPIPTETIVNGIACSMGSVIYAAGTTGKMYEHSVLMVHNPFYSNDSDREDQQLRSITKMISTIYQTRFGMSQDTVSSLMDGEDGEDGTYIDSSMALELGFVKPENIIRNEIQNKIDFSKITNKKHLDLIKNKLNATPKTINNKNNAINIEKMDNIFAALNVNNESSALSKITELMNFKSKFERGENEISSLKDANSKMSIENKGLIETKKNLEADIQSKKSENEALLAKVNGYEEKERLEAEAKVNAFLDNAIKDGKIPAESKGSWSEMAKSNFDTVKNTIDAIPSREVISNEISKGKIEAAETNNGKSPVDPDAKAKAIINAKVKELDPNFKFRTIN